MATSQVSPWVRLTTLLLLAGYTKAVESQPRLYPYGTTRGDTVVGCRSDHWGQSPAIMIPRGVKLFISETRALVVYTHGYVTLSQRSNFRTPVDIRKAMTPKVKKHSRRYGFAILAPLWTDNDCSRGKTFYHVYDSKKTTSDATNRAEKDQIMNKAKEDIVKYSGELDVTPTWILVVTWFQVLPRLNYNSERDQPNTYQLVFMSDRDKKKTYVLYLYESVGWDRTVHRRPSTIGYYETRWRRTQWKKLWMSNTTTAFRIADIVGNTGEVGKYFFPLTRSPASTGHTKCMRWYQAEKDKLSDIELRLSKTLPCPCDLPLLIADGRWKFDWKNYVAKPRQIRLCYYERQPSEQPSQYCCYNIVGALITVKDGSGGRLFLYHPRNPAEHRVHDVLPKKWCCDQSKNCGKFYEVRPMSNCLETRPPPVVGADDCANNPCRNGGTCTDGENTYTCTCLAGFSGTNCQLIGADDCANNPCRNGGTCTDGVGTYSCACRAGFSGAYCELNGADDCANNPCQNGGICTDGDNTYTCTCLAGFSGTNCQLTGTCSSASDCENGGTCYGNACHCTDHYIGDHCETAFQCVADTDCLNNGRCPVGSDVVCDCSSGYTGGNCALVYNCDTRSPCFKSNTDVNGFYYEQPDPHMFIQCDANGVCYNKPCGALVFDPVNHGCVLAPKR